MHNYVANKRYLTYSFLQKNHVIVGTIQTNLEDRLAERHS